MRDDWDYDLCDKQERDATLERDIQRVCIKLAKARGWRAYKFRSISHNNVPDYIFIRRNRRTGVKYILFCEFKRHKKVPSEAQEDEMNTLREEGCDVVWANSVDMFLGHLDARE